VDAARAGEVDPSEEYWVVSKRFARVRMAASVLVLVAVFFMTVKP
jgi:hypothetical protein